jgi:hypothetical protein
MDKQTEEYRAYLVKLAADNLCKGIIEEPRGYFDRLAMDTSLARTATFGTPNIFLNGEQFPVRILYMTASVAYLDQEGNADQNERLIQRIGLRMRHHDNFYMRNEYVPLPLWSNCHTAASEVVTQGTSSYVFERPLVLSSRDALVVRAVLEDTPATAVPVSVSFTGVGIYSKRPYFLFGEVFLSDETAAGLPVEQFRNDGAEPMLITDMTVNVGAPIGDADPTGISRRARISVHQNGNGTNALWFTSPGALLDEYAPAQLLGPSTGRAIVHRFPGDGLLWEPGEGLQVSARPLGVEFPDVSLDLGLLGYIAVQ